MFLINVNLNTGLLSLTEQKKENMMCSSGRIRNNLIDLKMTDWVTSIMTMIVSKMKSVTSKY